MASSEWTLHDDSKPYPNDTIDSGPETVIKAKYHRAVFTSQIAPANAYIEDPEGNQFEWNNGTSKWVEL